MRKNSLCLCAYKKGVELGHRTIQDTVCGLARPGGITGNYQEQFVKCGLLIDDELEAYLVSMGETEDLRALTKPA